MHQADRLGCSSWLLSSNVINTPFYEHCGFSIAKELVMGDNNPTWTRPPFKMLIVRISLVVLHTPWRTLTSGLVRQMVRAGRGTSSTKVDEKRSPL